MLTLPQINRALRTDLVNLNKINILSSPVDTSSTQSGDGNTVVRGGRKMRARRTLLGLDLSPDASDTKISLADLINLNKINVLSAPVDTHSEQSGDGNTVTRGGRKARSLLNLDVSPDVSPKVSLTDLLGLSKINVLSAPVDTHSEQSGDGNCVDRSGRKRGWTESTGTSGGLLNLNIAALLSGGSHKVDLSNLLGGLKTKSASTTTTDTTTTDTTTHPATDSATDIKAVDVNASPSVNPTIAASNLLNLDKINVLSAPVDTHSEQSGNGNTVSRGGRMAKRTIGLSHVLASLGLSNDQISKLNLNLANADASGANVSPDVAASNLLNLDKLNVLSAPVDTHSEQSGDGNTVIRGGRKVKRTFALTSLLSSLGLSDDEISSLNVGDVDVSPDLSPDVNLSDLLNLDTINVLSAPVDTHSEQSGDGNTVVRGGRMVKMRKVKK